MEGDRACARLSIYRRSCLSVEKYISPQYHTRSAKRSHEILGHMYKALGHGERETWVFRLGCAGEILGGLQGVFIESLTRGLCSKKCSRPKL